MPRGLLHGQQSCGALFYERANVVLLSILEAGLSSGTALVAECVGEVWSDETNEEPAKRSVSFWVRTRSDQSTVAQRSTHNQ